RLDRVVALKILREELAGDRELVERFEREAKLAASLSHPNVVGVHDFGRIPGRQGDTAFIAMDFIDGMTLKEYMRVGRLPVERAIEIASQILAGLGAAHA